MNELEDVQKKLKQFVTERDWAQFHDPKNLAMAVASEAGELLSLFRWIQNDEADSFCREGQDRESVVGEIADIAIFLLLLCDRINVNLFDAIHQKIEVNEKNHPVEKTRGHPRRVRP